MDINKNLVSVVIPTYNSEKYIYECLKSVLNQTYQNFEIIIIDNNSTDKTLEIIKRFNSKKISIFLTNNKGNISISRNIGIKNSKGSWISFLDSDDLWFPTKLEKLLDKMELYDFISHSMLIYKNKKIKKKFFFNNHTFSKRYKLIENLVKSGSFIFNSSVLVKKSLLIEIGYISEKQTSYTNDLYTWLKISLLTEKYYFESEDLGIYNQHLENYSSNSKASSEYLKCVAIFKKNFCYKIKKNILGYFYFIKAKENLIKKKFLKSIKYLCKSFFIATNEIKFKCLVFSAIILFNYLKWKVKK